MSWGIRRRNTIIGIFLSVVFIIIALVLFFTLYSEPTCFDGRKNGGEKGVDCGGACELLCTNQALDPLVKWNRYFEVIPGVYNAVAYIENQNTDAGSDIMEYKFTLFDRNNAIIAEKEGKVEVRPKEVIPIVENGMRTGQLTPARMTFEITNDIVWKKRIPRDPVLLVKDDEVYQVDSSPRVSAVLDNVGYSRITDINVIVILYNNDGNAIGVSSTYVEEILANTKKSILFTWPQNFVGEVARFEIIPLYEFN